MYIYTMGNTNNDFKYLLIIAGVFLFLVAIIGWNIIKYGI